MGEARFYLKAKFPAQKEAHQAKEIAELLFKDMISFGDDWQKIRNDHAKSPGERHKILLKKHRLVKELLDLPSPQENDWNMNYLAGECEMTEDYEMTLGKDNIIYLSALVWHLGSWDNLCRVFEKLGAVATGWVSDEHADYWMCVDMETATSKKIPEGRLKSFKKLVVVNKV